MSEDQVRSRVEARVESLVAAIVDGVTATPGEVRGLTAEQNREDERDQPAPLGAGYRRFLELAGGGAGRFRRGSDVFPPLVLGLGAAGRELLAENAVPFALTGADRVIL